VGECQGGIFHPSEATVSCDYQIPACVNFTYSDWSVCNSSEVQSRTVLSASPSGCTGGNPVLNKTCNYIPLCDSDTWSCGDWSDCSASGSQARVCTKIFDCPDIETKSPITNQDCEIINQDSQNEPQPNQIQDEPILIKDNEQQVSEERKITNLQVEEERRDEVVGVVQEISQVAEENSGVNQQIEIIAQTQVQNQGEESQVQNQEQIKTQTQSESAIAEQRKNQVANAVQEILQVAERNAGIGQQVRVIAQVQNENQEKLEASLQKIQSRRGFIKFFIGANYGEIDNAKKALEQNREQIKQFNQIESQPVNQDDQQKLTEQIRVLEQANLQVENSLNTAQKSFSLFGWLFRLFVK